MAKKRSALLVVNLVDKITRPAKKIQRTMTSVKKSMKLKGVDLRWKRLQDSMRAFNKTARGTVGFMSKMSGATALVGFAADRALSMFTNKVDQVAKKAKVLNMTTEELQELRHAAGLMAGVGANQFDKFSTKFVDALTEYRTFGTGEAANVLAGLGVGINDANGNIKPTAKLLMETADAFKRIEDPALRTHAAVTLFGARGADLVNFLSAGSSEIHKFRKEFTDLGATVSAETAALGEQYNDNRVRLQAFLSGFGVAIATKLLPHLVKLTDQMVAWAKAYKHEAHQRFFTELKSIWATIKKISSAVKSVVDFLGGWKNAVLALFAVMGLGVLFKFVFVVGSLTSAMFVLGKLAIPLVTAALKWLAIAAAMNPIGALVAAIAGVAALIYANWEPIKDFFSGLFSDIKRIFNSAWDWISNKVQAMSALVPSFMFDDKSETAPIKNVRRARGRSSVSSGKTEVGGELHIRIDSEGRPKVQTLAQHGSSMGLRVDTGYLLQ